MLDTRRRRGEGRTARGLPQGQAARGREASATRAQQLWKEFLVWIWLVPKHKPDTVAEDVVMKLLTCALLP
jgi:hypothetical protein